MKRGRFQSLGERLGKRMNTWWEKDLSFGGKEVHIKAIAQAIPTYTMSVFRLQDGVCDDLEKMIKRYWWGAKNGKRRTHWIAWQRLVRSKGSGGMGFRDLKLCNKALLARQAWRLIEYPDSLCTRVLKAKYFPNGELLDTVFPQSMSPSWRAVVFGLELLKEGLIWRVGDGKSIKIWRHSWLPRDLGLRVLGKTRPCRLKWVAQLLDEEGSGWNHRIIDRYFLPHDAEVIKAISVPDRQRQDIAAWHYEKTGICTVRSAYRLAVRLEDRDRNVQGSSSSPWGERSMWNKVWKLQVPEKVRIFIWRVISAGLPTKLNKWKRTLETSKVCSICGIGIPCAC